MPIQILKKIIFYYIYCFGKQIPVVKENHEGRLSISERQRDERILFSSAFGTERALNQMGPPQTVCSTKCFQQMELECIPLLKKDRRFQPERVRGIDIALPVTTSCVCTTNKNDYLVVSYQVLYTMSSPCEPQKSIFYLKQ